MDSMSMYVCVVGVGGLNDCVCVCVWMCECVWMCVDV